MRFEGKLKKSGKHWISEIPALGACTQGRTRSDAFAMTKDLVETMAGTRRFEVTVHPLPDDRFEISANDVRILIAVLLRRQREKSGLTLSDVAARLRQKSRNAYARYERGDAVPTIDKLEELLEAVAPGKEFVWRLAS
jgi:ribosome-binding protein aMBF1 (putative translation factor)